MEGYIIFGAITGTFILLLVSFMAWEYCNLKRMEREYKEAKS